MNTRNKPRKTLARAISVIAAMSAAPYLQAQNSLVLEEILVTAQKRSESIQDVPISITALSGDQIAATGAVDFETLSDSLPNVDISSAPGIKSIAIRGMRSGSGNVAFEQSVGLYVDGIYASRVALFQEPFLDVDRLEVLKGPQGVLFGKNSIAGALATHSAKPTEEFEASISGTYELEYDSYQAIGVISGPVTDNFFARLAVKDGSMGAYLNNGATGPDAGEDETTTIRGSFVWDATDDTSIYLKVETSEIYKLGDPWQMIADPDPGTFAATFSAAPRGTISAGANGALAGIRAGFPAIPSTSPLPIPLASPFGGLATAVGQLTFIEALYYDSTEGGETFADDNTSYLNERTFTDQESDNVTFQLTHNIGESEIVYLAGLAQFDRSSLVDSDFSAVQGLGQHDTRDFKQTSHELRFVSPKGETLEYIVGAYYLDRELNVDRYLDFFHGTAGNADFYQNLAISRSQLYSEDADSLAIFANVAWNITDDFKVSVGARYSEEEKTASNGEERFVMSTRDNLAVNDPDKYAFITRVFGESDYSYERTIKEYALDPSVNFQWNYNDNSMAYLSWTQATKAGGFDASAGIDDADTAFSFNPEEATSIEIGLKTEFLDGRARVNAAIFFTEFEDLQVSSFDPNAGTTGAFVTTNAAKANTDGIELDVLLAASENLTVGASVAYLKAEYDEFEVGCPSNVAEQARLNCFVAPGGGTTLLQDLSGVQMENAPEWTGTLFGEYMIPLERADIGIRVDANYKDDTSLDFSQDSNLFEDAYWKVNLNLSLNSADDVWSLGLGVFNLTDEQPTNFGGQAFVLSGVYWKNLTRGREVKATATYRFF